MLFSLVLVVLTAAVAFIHYVQGFFSATISVILIVFAAAVAVGWHETLAPLLFNIYAFDQAASISIIVLFAAAYIVPRLLMDKLVPGNVRFNSTTDKIGAGVMGLIAGLICTGVLAIAAEELPFGPAIMMYSRFATIDVPNAIFMNNRLHQNQDTVEYDVLAADSIYPDAVDSDGHPALQHVWFRQDDLLVGLLSKFSDGGSLAGDVLFTSIHPDFVDEIYGQRIGIQPGAMHYAVTTPQDRSVQLKGVYAPGVTIPQVDGVANGLRPGGYRNPSDPPLVPPLLQPRSSDGTPDPDKLLLVVRLAFTKKELADPSDNVMRFSAGAIRLMTGQPDNSAPYRDYHPVATLDPKGVAVACRPDDFLFADMGKGDRTIDFVFQVDKDHLQAAKAGAYVMPSGSFVQFKRYSILDLGNTHVEAVIPPNPDQTGMMRMVEVQQNLDKLQGIIGAGPAGATAAPAPAPGQTGQAANHALGNSGLTFMDIAASSKLPGDLKINCGMGNATGPVQLTNGVSGDLQDRKWLHLIVNTQATIAALGQPVDDDIQDLFVGPNQVLVQVHCAPPASGDLWGWSKNLADYTLADATGHPYKCVGAFAKTQQGPQNYLAARYSGNQQAVQNFDQEDGRPIDIWLTFAVPKGTVIAQARAHGGTPVGNLNFKAQ